MRSPTARTLIWSVFWLQIGISAILVGGDLVRSMPALFTRTNAPDFGDPVAPGDQTRRFDPSRLPERPQTPTRPYPARETMPDRLVFTEIDVEGTPALSMRGAIGENDVARFEDWLETRALAQDVYLDSPGGSVQDALAIGRILRARGVTTIVAAGDICFSACPYIFASGTKRIADRAGSVGVHQHYFGENLVLPAFVAVEEIQYGQSEVVDYLDKMGVDLRLMRPALATPPDEIYVLLPEELIDFSLATEISGQTGPTTGRKGG